MDAPPEALCAACKAPADARPIPACDGSLRLCMGHLELLPPVGAKVLRERWTVREILAWALFDQ